MTTRIKIEDILPVLNKHEPTDNTLHKFDNMFHIPCIQSTDINQQQKEWDIESQQYCDTSSKTTCKFFDTSGISAKISYFIEPKKLELPY